MRLWRLVAIGFCAFTSLAVARPSDHAHPRLLFPASMDAKIKQRIATDPLAAELQKNILSRADAILSQRTCRFEKSDGRRLLPESRDALNRILHCAWAWRTTGEEKYKQRILAEMDAACAMPSWNPDHFLDTAEMATAMAIGYDWLYPSLSPEQRKKYADALDEKGLLALVNHKHKWWKSPTNNWSQVCGTGMEFAAIALDEVQPQRCAEVLAESHQLVEDCVRFYQPDGAYPEGPGYWHYGSNYQVMHFAAQQVITGKKPVADIWKQTAEFMIHQSGPTGLSFNYADSGTRGFYLTAAQTWIAAQFPQSALPRWTRDALGTQLKLSQAGSSPGEARFHPLHLLWLPPHSEKAPAFSLTARFGGEQEVAFARTGWNADASWLAIKGGTGAASHGHLDAGSFVYEAGGVRWFYDLGSDNYNMPGYFGKQRWEYFRLNNRSHNTLVIADALQAAPMPGCPVTPWQEEVDQLVGCEIDLTRAYAKQCASAKRMVFFHRANGGATLEDRIEKPTGDVRWAVVTDARFTIQGRTVKLQKNGKTLIMQRKDITGGEWQEFSLQPPTAQENTNKGFRIIGFRVSPSDQVKVRVGWELSTNEKEQ
jgi:hypothetical protein